MVWALQAACHISNRNQARLNPQTQHWETLRICSCHFPWDVRRVGVGSVNVSFTENYNIVHSASSWDPALRVAFHWLQTLQSSIRKTQDAATRDKAQSQDQILYSTISSWSIKWDWIRAVSFSFPRRSGFRAIYWCRRIEMDAKHCRCRTQEKKCKLQIYQ